MLEHARSSAQLAAALGFATVLTLGAVHAVALGNAKASIGFEDGAEGFAAIATKDGQVGSDPSSTVSIVRDANLVKAGSASLAYRFPIEAGAIRLLAAETRLPSETRSIRFWVRSDSRTILMFSLREQGGAAHQLPFQVPANEWMEIAANLDEFVPEQEGKALGEPVQPGTVTSVSLVDLAHLLVNAPEPLKSAFPNTRGPRTLWIDDLRFSAERVPQTLGRAQADGKSYFLVDSFESSRVEWLPVRVNVANGAPTFSVFAEDHSVVPTTEAAGPGAGKSPLEAGGRGLRFAYRRAAGEINGVLRNVEHYDLARAQRLRICMNFSRRSLATLQLKEKGGAEYQVQLSPDSTQGWQTLSPALSDFTLADNSKDDNNHLDPDQIKEIVILDASPLAELETGDTTLDLDAVAFELKP
jgi:hypothetical protein